MLVWGSKGEVADLGVQASQHCPTCAAERQFRLMLQYKVHHIWYVFKWVTGKEYSLVCEVCHRGEKLKTQEVEAKLGVRAIGVLPLTQSNTGMHIERVFTEANQNAFSESIRTIRSSVLLSGLQSKRKVVMPSVTCTTSIASSRFVIGSGSAPV